MGYCTIASEITNVKVQKIQHWNQRYTSMHHE
jgi:hypothetical protein